MVEMKTARLALVLAAGPSAAFVARYRADGALEWARSAGGRRGETVVHALASLPGGDMLATGAFKEPIVVGAGRDRLLPGSI